MPQVFTLRPREAREWMGVLRRSCGFDFYHTPGYHALAEARGEGEAWLVDHQGPIESGGPLPSTTVNATSVSCSPAAIPLEDARRDAR